MSSFFDEDTEVVPLITCKDGTYTVCESTLSWLESLTEVRPIACAGKYRTGKSFLLNRLANAPSNVGFGVGDSVQACTKGLWVYKKVFRFEDKQIVFIDTEGIDALDANDTHDVRIFTLALLLCSTFIYNSMGPIDETALQTLSLMTRVTDNVKFDIDEKNEGTSLAPHMPNFYWVLRDFSLKLTNKDNNSITEDEYLEQALQLSSDPNKNAVREAVRNSFKTRSLITLPRPSTTNDISSQRMEDRLASLSRNFVSTVESLRNRLFDEIRPMQADTSTLNGKMYAALCRHYTEVVQGDAVPVIKDSWTMMAAVQARDVKDTLLAECSEKILSMTPKVRRQLDEDMKALKEQILQKFVTKAMKPVDVEVKSTLEIQVNKIIDDAKNTLELNVTALIEKSFEDIEPDIQENPEQIASILNLALQSFSNIYNDPEMIQTYQVMASERALCRWIPRSLQILSTQRDETAHAMELAESKHVDDMKNLTESVEDTLRQEKVRHSELEQLHDSDLHTIAIERNDNMRLRHDIMSLTTEIHSLENVAERENYKVVCSDFDGSHTQEKRDDDEIARVSIECAELKSKLALERSDHEKCKRLYSDSNERLERSITIQAELESSWKMGIENLREEQEILFTKQQTDHEAHVSQLKTDVAKCQQQYDAKCLQNQDLITEKKRLDERFAQEVCNNERTVSTLRENAQRYREQSDKAQNRVLEIHKSMIEDLQLRDQRARDQQCKHLEETCKYQQKISDLTKETEMQKSEILQSKRRLEENESLENENKRFKTIEREKDILIAQLRTETNELRVTNSEMLHERETIRKENMRMEGELTLLRAEQQLNNARKAMKPH